MHLCHRAPVAITILLFACNSDTVPSIHDGTSSAGSTDASAVDADNSTSMGESSADEHSSSSDGTSASCGDGFVDEGEECDLGELNANDSSCTLDCKNAFCGDALVGPGEGCDEGIANADDGACLPTCVSASCGDGELQAGVEACDDGAANAPDAACLPTCAAASCGDGFVRAGSEECDEGDANGDTAACRSDCVAASCGDGFVWRGIEQCDQGAANADDAACSTSCTNAACGDGLLWAGVEECDDGVANSDDAACLSTCLIATCGDGFVQAGVEGCDEADANGENAACLSSCTSATCGDGFLWAGVEECDDGSANADDAGCLTSCQTATCGDNFVWTGVEACDEGGANANDAACLASCVVASCGDTFVQADVEMCDDGNADESDGCRDDCTQLSDFVLVYIAGEAPTDPAGLGGSVGLRSHPWHVEIHENGDFVVFGEEQYNAGGQAGIRYGNALWRFSGATGELMWKHVDGYLQHVKLGFIGLGTDEGSYVAMSSSTPYTPEVRKFDAEGNIEWTITAALRDQLRDALLAVNRNGTWVDGGVVTQADEVVMAMEVDRSSAPYVYTFFAGYASATEQLFISSVPQVVGPLPLVERPSGSLLTVAADTQLQTSTGGDRVTILHLSMPDGTITTTPLDLSDYVAGPIGPSTYDPSWIPIDFIAPADSTDIWIAVNEYYFDNGNAPKVHLFRVAEDGTVLEHVLGDLDPYMDLVNLYQYRGMAETSEGLVLAGTWTEHDGPSWDWPVAPRYSDDLVRLGDFTVPELASSEAEWFDVATRNGRTIFVGTIEHVTMLMTSVEVGG